MLKEEKESYPLLIKGLFQQRILIKESFSKVIKVFVFQSSSNNKMPLLNRGGSSKPPQASADGFDCKYHPLQILYFVCCFMSPEFQDVEIIYTSNKRSIQTKGCYYLLLNAFVSKNFFHEICCPNFETRFFLY